MMKLPPRCYLRTWKETEQASMGGFNHRAPHPVPSWQANIGLTSWKQTPGPFCSLFHCESCAWHMEHSIFGGKKKKKRMLDALNTRQQRAACLPQADRSPCLSGLSTPGLLFFHFHSVSASWSLLCNIQTVMIWRLILRVFRAYLRKDYWGNSFVIGNLKSIPLVFPQTTFSYRDCFS